MIRWSRKLPWPQEPWSSLGRRLIAIHLINLNRVQKIEPMEKV